MNFLTESMLSLLIVSEVTHQTRPTEDTVDTETNINHVVISTRSRIQHTIDKRINNKKEQ